MNQTIANLHIYLFGGELSNITIDFNKLTFNVKQDQFLTVEFSFSDLLLKLYTEVTDTFPSFKRNMTIDIKIPTV